MHVTNHDNNNNTAAAANQGKLASDTALPKPSSLLGLAAGNGLLVVSTSNGVIYCFGSSKGYQSQSAYPVRKESSPAIQSSDIDYAKAAEEILDSARIKSGICIDLG